MKKRVKILGIINLIIYLVSIPIIIILRNEGITLDGILMGASVLTIIFLGVGVIAGIPSLIKKRLKQPTLFLPSFTVGFFVVIIWWIIAYINRLQDVTFIGFCIIAFFLLIHVIFVNSVLAVYQKLFGPFFNSNVSTESEAKLRTFFKKLSNGQKVLGIFAIIFILIMAILFFNSTRIVDISETEDIDARSGLITITYNDPIRRPVYIGKKSTTHKDSLYIQSWLSEDRKTETIRIIKPTHYNNKYVLHRRHDWAPDTLFSPKKKIAISTGIEEVKIARLIPAENSNPAPETLDNQIAIQFQGEAIGKYKKSVNIPIDEMDYVKLLTPVNGYFRWSDDTLLTFNFIGDKPGFSKTYSFEVFPEKFINSDYQKWIGKKTVVNLTTSKNEVYVTNFSLRNKVNWQDRLRITFSGSMVGALDILKKKSQNIVPISITPTTGGIWVWVNAKTIEFQPDNKTGWPVKQNVKIVIDPSINKDFERSWRTEKQLEHSFYVAPRVQSIQSYNLHGDQIGLERNLEVRFSRKMVPANQTRTKIFNQNITPKIPFILTPHIDGYFIWKNSEKVSFTPNNLWPELKEIKVSLNPSFNPDPRFDWTGTKYFKFKTVESLVTPSFYLIPEKGVSVTAFFQDKNFYAWHDTEPLTELKLWILFDKEIGRHIDKTKDLSKLVSITPEIQGKYVWLNNNILEFTPENNWRELTSYKIELKKGLLYHPEQHFPKNINNIKFKTSENKVYSTLLTEKSSDPDKTLSLGPDEKVHFEFSKNMNPSLKVGKLYYSRKLVGISPPVTITPNENVTFLWKDKRNLIIKNESYWKSKTKYKFALNKKSLPQYESKYNFNGTVYYTTTKNIFRIKHFSPQGRTGLHPIINVVFDKKIKPQSTELGGEDTEGLFQISPKLEGTWIWLSDEKIQFKPKNPLISSNQYTVYFNANKIQDKQFTWYASDLKTGKSELEKFSFHTPIFNVHKSSARFEFNKEDFLKQKFYVDIQLSDPVKEADLRKHFSIWYKKENGSEVPLIYNFDFKNESDKQGIKEFSVVSDWIERPANDRRIHYKITEGLKPIDSNLGLSQDFSSDFLQEKPKYIKLKNISWNWKDRQYSAFMTLNSPVNPEVLKKFLTIRKRDDIEINYELGVANSSNTRTFKYEISAKFIPGGKYKFKIKEGLLAADGALTSNTISRASYSPDLEQKIKFLNKGHFLSKKDLMSVPIVTTNIRNIQVNIDQIYANNVNFFFNNNIPDSDISKVAKRVHSKQYDVGMLVSNRESLNNQELVTHLDLRKLFKHNKHGLFKISIDAFNNYEQTNPQNQRWFLATDIGLISRRFGDNVIIWAYSLENTMPLSGTKIELIDPWNQTVAKGVTNSKGYLNIRIEDRSILKHMVAYRGDDFSFLDFNRHKESLTGQNTEGISSGIEDIRSYIYSERGVYRPGEIAHIVAISRSTNGTLPENYNVKFIITDPKGKDILTERYKLDNSGANLLDFSIPAEAKTGKWKASVLWKDSLIGTYTFQVEEFVPNKIKVELLQLAKDVSSGELLKFKVVSKNLFGPPASGRPVIGKIQLRASYFKPKGYSHFIFGHEKIKFQRIDTDLLETRLNEQGEYVYEYRIPENIQSPIGLSANYSATVVDDGGRGVAAYKQTNISLFNRYVGIRRLTKGILTLDKPVDFQVVNVEANGKKIERNQQKLVFKIFRNRLLTHYRKNERGYYRYVTERQEVLIDTLTDPRNSFEKFSYLPKYSGAHILEVEDKVGNQVTRYNFTIRGEDKEQLIQPSDKVEFKILNNKINIGDTIKLEITTPFKGKLLLIGERETVLFNKVITMDSKRTIIKLPAKKAYFPNFYVSATAIKPVKKGDRHNPIYSTGLVNIDISDKKQSPHMKLSVPSQISPNGKLTVKLKVSDTNNSSMYYTIAAVDVGILNLTRYELPDMEGYFNHKQRLEVDHFSIYSMVMPYDPNIKRKITPSGGAPSRALIKKKRVSPVSQRRISSVVLWSGILKTNKNGEGKVTFDVPDFDGTLKVMAVAHGDQRFASSEKEVLVKDKLVVKSTLPRFLATGDTFYLPVFLFNDTGKNDFVRVTLRTTEHVEIQGADSRTIELPHNGKQEVGFLLKVNNEVGVSTYEIVAEGDKERTRKIIHVPVRTPGTMASDSGSGVVDKFTPKSISMPDIFVRGTEQYAMKITNNKLWQFTNSISYLLRYPHGCLEQTTSKVFPLLIFGAIAESMEKSKGFKSANYYLKKGIAKIERMQLEDGAFSYWEGGSRVNQWAFVYASHFLVEAQKAGMKINESVWNNMIFRLNQDLSQKTEFNYYNSLDKYIYTLYVLALANENISSKLNYIFEKYDGELRPHQKARLAAAYFISGDSDTAKNLISQIPNFVDYKGNYRFTGGDFSSNIRDLAIILDAILIVSPDSPHIDQIIKILADSTYHGRWGSTQENAYAFLAIGKALTKGKAFETKGKPYETNVKVTLGDGTSIPFKQSVILNTPELLKGEARIEVEGEGAVNFTWEAFGIERAPKSMQVDKNVRVRRRFLDRKGNLAKMDQIQQGDLVVAEIKIKSLDTKIDNLIICDLLPTGLEIENARLSTSASLPWIKQSIKPDYIDIRDDRINIFLTIDKTEKTIYYIARAVTKGEFKIPMIVAEAMYDPNIFSRADGGKLKVISKELAK